MYTHKMPPPPVYSTISIPTLPLAYVGTLMHIWALSYTHACTHAVSVHMPTAKSGGVSVLRAH